MYYHVNIETTEQVGTKTKTNRQHYRLDSTDLEKIKESVVQPFLEGKKIHFDGYFLSSSEIKRIAIKRSDKSTTELSQYENDNMPSNVIYFVSRENIFGYDKYTTDITLDTFAAVKATLGVTTTERSEVQAAKPKSKKVFIVHGRDNEAKSVAARFVDSVKHQAIILHEQVSAGMTVIEKIEAHSDVDFAIVLYTPCDVGTLAGTGASSRPRARQNVVFEHGFLIGKLSRSKVCALVKGDIELPNDISGVVYIPMDEHGAWKFVVAKEMKQAGCDVDLNDI